VTVVDSVAERYTLRLLEHVLHDVIATSKLRRSTSVQSFWTCCDVDGVWSERSVWLGQSGRWPHMLHLAATASASSTAVTKTHTRGHLHAARTEEVRWAPLSTTMVSSAASRSLDVGVVELEVSWKAL
jgi:hypothetical protein